MIKKDSDGDNTFNKLDDFGVGVVNSTLGQDSRSALLPDNVVTFMVIGLMVTVGATVLGFNYLRGVGV